MGALCHQPFGLGRQPSGCCVRLLDLGTTKAFVAFLVSLGWRPSAAPTHYLDTLLVRPRLFLKWGGAGYFAPSTRRPTLSTTVMRRHKVAPLAFSRIV